MQADDACAGCHICCMFAISILKLEFIKSRHHRWEEQLAQFNLHVTYREGRLNTVPDALSRRPDHKAEPPANQPVLAAVSSLNPDPAFLISVREATSADDYAQMVISRMVLADTEFATFSLDDGLLFNTDRLYIPPVPELRTKVMQAMHDCNVSGYLGMDKTEELTSRSFFGRISSKMSGVTFARASNASATKPATAARGVSCSLSPSPSSDGNKSRWI
jgi:hypothetical protein